MRSRFVNREGAGSRLRPYVTDYRHQRQLGRRRLGLYRSERSSVETVKDAHEHCIAAAFSTSTQSHEAQHSSKYRRTSLNDPTSPASPMPHQQAHPSLFATLLGGNMPSATYRSMGVPRCLNSVLVEVVTRDGGRRDTGTSIAHTDRVIL